MPSVSLQPSIGKLPPSDVVQMFTKAGVASKVESTGKIFPQSDRALDVRNALHGMAVDAGVRIELGAAVAGVTFEADSHDRASPNCWIVQVSNTRRGQSDDAARSIEADRVIVTAGGKSWPGCGTTGDAYDWLSQLGHTIVTPRPALVPLVGGDTWMRGLSGITLDDCVATVRPKSEDGVVMRGRKSMLASRRSSLLLTHFGLSGPAAMDVSGVMTEAKSLRDVQLELDLLPDETEESLNAELTPNGKQASLRVSQLVRLRLPQRLADALVNRAGQDRPLSELPAKQRKALLTSLKHLPVPIHDTRGFAKAEVTAGGVELSEVNPRTMESRRHPGLFIAGEVLDVDGWIGGYNFQAAFSTGYAAGTAAATHHT